MPTSRKNIMLGTAGHVDHGKTALVKILTGCNTDTLAAEQQRGLTIELGFAPCRMADERIVGIVDVPGHVGFIRNMVSGAHGVDVVVLVVAADDGVMPQTREHLDILTLMGVRRGLVALTKIDMVDGDLREMAAEDVREFVRGTFLEGAPVCGVSNITGEGFDGFLTALNAAVDACQPRETSGLFRLWTERVFTIRGFGTVVSGIPTSGIVRVGDRLALAGAGRSGRVRRMQVYGQDAEEARAGECVAVNLADVDTDLLGRGRVLCEGQPTDPAAMFEAELRLLDHAAGAMKDYTEVHVHVGTAEAMANVAMLAGDALAPGQRQMVQMRLHTPLPVAPGDRLVIRCGLGGPAVTTVGGGRVLSVANVRLRRNRPWTLQALAARRDGLDDPSAWCALHLQEAGEALAADELARRARMPLGQVETILKDLESAGLALAAGPASVVHRSVVEQLGERIVGALTEFHAAETMRVGLDAGQLRSQLEAAPPLFDLAVGRLTEAAALERHGELLALAGHATVLSPADRNLCNRLETLLREANLAPPLPADLAGTLGVDPARLEKLISLLIDQGLVLRPDAKVVLHRNAVAAAQKVLLDLFRTQNSFTTMEFRDALGVSRKYAVPLLDYFDTIRWTVRSGNRRTPGVEARRALEDA